MSKLNRRLFSALTGLALLGYDTTDPEAARRAFHLRYLPQHDPLVAAAIETELAHCVALTPGRPDRP